MCLFDWSCPHHFLYNPAYLEHDRQCTYDVTVRRVRLTLLAVDKQQVLHICLCVCVNACGCPVRGDVRACSFAYPSCNAYAPYCDIVCVPSCLHNIFRHYLINGTILGNTLLSIKCVIRRFLQLLCKTFLILTIN